MIFHDCIIVQKPVHITTDHLVILVVNQMDSWWILLVGESGGAQIYIENRKTLLEWTTSSLFFSYWTSGRFHLEEHLNTGVLSAYGWTQWFGLIWSEIQLHCVSISTPIADHCELRPRERARWRWLSQEWRRSWLYSRFITFSILTNQIYIEQSLWANSNRFDI